MSDEYVIKGNAAVLKCNIPSFIIDHLEVIEWIDSNGAQYNKNSSGTYINKKTFSLSNYSYKWIYIRIHPELFQPFHINSCFCFLL